MTAWDPPQASSTDDEAAVTGALTVDPFTSLAAHYGMLLGVSDFQVMGANPRGKMRLHQAWQHGPGVTWGLGVKLSDDRHSLVVCPGLAIDWLGREMAVSAEMCLDLYAWCKEQFGSPASGGPSEYKFSAHLWLEHDACPTRRVPSVRSSCAQADDSVQYSRVHEFGRLELEPYQPAEDRCVPHDQSECDCDERDTSYEALRALVRDGELPELPRTPEGWLDAFRSVAALETAGPGCEKCGKAASGFPFPDVASSRVLLADLRKVVLRRGDDGSWTASAELIDISVRRSHLSTWLIEELLAESLAGQRGPGPVPDAEGPRVSKVEMRAHRIVVELTSDVFEGTVADALEVRSIDRRDPGQGWSYPFPLTPRTTRANGDRPARIVVPLPPGGSPDLWYRVVLRGTGTTPLIGLGGSPSVPVPLAGRVGGPPGSAHDGHDVVAMIRSGADQ